MKPFCVSALPVFLCHMADVHLRDQKAHMQMRLQEVFDKKQLDPNAMDVQVKPKTAWAREFCGGRPFKKKN